MILFERARLRLEDTEDALLNELLTTVNDRLCIRLGVMLLPYIFESICVDATVKMYRRLYYEGITSEGTDGLSTSFVDDVLAEYNEEITAWKETQSNKNGTERVVRFL
ncbi:MAG: phage head-tail connector protein [Longicatena sp.]